MLKNGLRWATQRMGYDIVSITRRGIDLTRDIRHFLGNPPQMVVFDVGANVGETVAKFCAEYPSARIFAFEPIHQTYEELTERCKTLENVKAFEIAFGAASGDLEVFLQPKNVCNSLKIDVNKPNAEMDERSQTVTLKTLDEFCTTERIERIDLLKTDTEGFDLEVLRGSERMLAEGRIRAICSEVGFSESDERHTFFPNILTMLRQHGFELLALGEWSLTPSGSINYANAVFGKTH